jgi:type IV pilus biogenesis protein CpaD/CtpE
MDPRTPIRLAALAAAAAVLAGCEHRPPPPPVATPPQQVETGSKLTLATPLSFPAGSADLLFQNEQLVTAAKLARDQPYCKLVADSGARTTIAPGTFTVGAVNYDEREVGVTAGMVSVTRIALASDATRAGYTLSCGWPPGSSRRGFVNTEQIYDAIGGKYFSMNLQR